MDPVADFLDGTVVTPRTLVGIRKAKAYGVYCLTFGTGNSGKIWKVTSRHRQNPLPDFDFIIPIVCLQSVGIIPDQYVRCLVGTM